MGHSFGPSLKFGACTLLIDNPARPACGKLSVGKGRLTWGLAETG
jgi:hypothetical protein